MTILASPSVRAYEVGKGVDLEALAAKIQRQTIVREDVDLHLGAGKVPHKMENENNKYWDVNHSQYGETSAEPLSNIARLTAQNLAAAQALIPAVTHHDRADLSAIEAFRTETNKEGHNKGVKLTALPFHVKAMACCLEAFPRFNSSLSADFETLVLKHFVHIGIAVDTPYGLVVPVIRDANKKGLLTIAAEIKELAGRATERKIRPEEMGGASSSISSLGGIGGTAFTPIVNPPEVAILGITRTEVTPIWDGNEFVPTPMVPLDLSYDHRVINGADAARFMTNYVKLLEKPERLLIGGGVQ